MLLCYVKSLKTPVLQIGALSITVNGSVTKSRGYSWQIFIDMYEHVTSGYWAAYYDLKKHPLPKSICEIRSTLLPLV